MIAYNISNLIIVNLVFNAIDCYLLKDFGFLFGIEYRIDLESWFNIEIFKKYKKNLEFTQKIF